MKKQHQIQGISAAQRSVEESDRKFLESSLVSRNVMIGGHRTSIRLEAEMWEALRDICQLENTNVGIICTKIAKEKKNVGSYTSAVRVFIVRYLRLLASDKLKKGGLKVVVSHTANENS